MLYSKVLALAAATLAAAAPTMQVRQTTENSFNVANFVFGCTSGCYWSFDLGVVGSAVNHPALPANYACEGSLNEDTNYVECDTVSTTQTLYAYIVKDTNELKLRYEVVPGDGSVYNYYGNRTVYAATSANASLQETDFLVPETSATGVL